MSIECLGVNPEPRRLEAASADNPENREAVSVPPTSPL